MSTLRCLPQPALRTVARGLRFPEGPVCLPDGSIAVTEIASGTIRRCHADGRSEIVAETGGGPNGAQLGPDGALYVCNNGGLRFDQVPSRGWLLPVGEPPDYHGGSIQRVDLASGAVSTLYTECDGRPLRGPNDLVFDRRGGFWFTDHGKIRERDRDHGGIYYARVDGRSIRELVFPLDAPNGIALSPEQSRLYVAESFTARVWAFDVTAPGEVSLKPRARVHGAELVAGLDGYHVLDSMAVDDAGNVCVATFGDHTGITVLRPDRSAAPKLLELPGPMPTNICFAGSTAFATLSAQGELVSWEWEPGCDE